MIFAPSTIDNVLNGSKTETRRLVRNYKPPVRVGRAYSIQQGRGKHAVGYFFVKSVRKERLLDITEAGAVKEGFPNREAFLREFARLNRGQLANPEVWVIEFQLASDAQWQT